MLESPLKNTFCLEGASFFRIFEGKYHFTTPFLGINRWGVVGIGLKFYDGKRSPIFYGAPSTSYKLIALRRALELLKKAKGVTDNGSTFVNCITLFQPDEYRAAGDESYYIRALAEQFGGEKRLRKMYGEILESFPDIAELEYLLTWMHEREVCIDLSELMSELWWYQRQCGLVVDLPIIRKLRDEHVPLPAPTPTYRCSRWRAFWYGLTLGL